MNVSVFFLVLLALVAAVLAFPSQAERAKRSPHHHSKYKVKIIERGPWGFRKHKYRYKGYGWGHGHYAADYGYGGYGGYGGLGSYGSLGRSSSSSFATSFSSPFGSFASAGASAGR